MNFISVLEKLEGRTIRHIVDNSCEELGTTAVIVCEDGTQISIRCYDNELVAETYHIEAASKRHLYDPVVSARRGELYIYSTEDDSLLFTVPNEEVIHGMEHLDKEGLYDELEMSYSDILAELHLMN